eukprot:scaffold2764_cov399-Prasinococcus_capsulatus_cf.AAC.2
MHTFGGIHTLNGHTGTVLSLKLNADATKLYSGSEDQTVKVWLMAEARCLQSIPAHAGGILALELSHDGQYLYSASTDKSINAWPLQEPDLAAALLGQDRAAALAAVTAGDLYPDEQYDSKCTFHVSLEARRLHAKVLEEEDTRVSSEQEAQKKLLQAEEKLLIDTRAATYQASQDAQRNLQESRTQVESIKHEIKLLQDRLMAAQEHILKTEEAAKSAQRELDNMDEAVKAIQEETKACENKYSQKRFVVGVAIKNANYAVKRAETLYADWLMRTRSKEPNLLSVKDIGQVLRFLDLHDLEPVFAANKLAGAAFCAMNEQQLRASDIKLTIPERKRILVAAQGLLVGRSPVDGPGMVPECTAWSAQDVQTWLVDLGLESVRELFTRAKVGDRAVIMNQIAAITKEHPKSCPVS